MLRLVSNHFDVEIEFEEKEQNNMRTQMIIIEHFPSSFCVLRRLPAQSVACLPKPSY